MGRERDVWTKDGTRPAPQPKRRTSTQRLHACWMPQPRSYNPPSSLSATQHAAVISKSLSRPATGSAVLPPSKALAPVICKVVNSRPQARASDCSPLLQPKAAQAHFAGKPCTHIQTPTVIYGQTISRLVVVRQPLRPQHSNCIVWQA